MALLLLCLLAGSLSAQQIRIRYPGEGLVVDPADSQTVIVQGQPGKGVLLFLGSTLLDRGVIPPDGIWRFRGLNLPEGPVTVTARLISAPGETLNTDCSFYNLGPLAKIEMMPSRKEIVADGATPFEMNIKLLDAGGKQLQHSVVVTCEVSGADFLSSDLDPVKDGMQVRVDSGQVAVSLTAGDSAGRGWFEVTGENGVVGHLDLVYNTNMRPFLLTGLITGTTGVNVRQGNELRGDGDSEVPKGLYGSGRMAFTGTGGVGSWGFLTVSYDSKRRVRDKLFREFEPERIYPLLGDASQTRYLVQSKSDLYVRLEKNLSYVQFGDFLTTNPKVEFSSYNRAFTGVSGNLESDKLQMTGFFTRTNRFRNTDEQQGNGTSGYYYLTYRPTEGSEQVRIETRDYYRSERILETKTLVRWVDYTIDYDNRTLLFKQPVRHQDGWRNPTWIVVDYEAQSAATDKSIGGLRGDYHPAQWITLGGGVTIEEQLPKNYYLAGANVRMDLGPQRWIKAEYGLSAQDQIDGATLLEAGWTFSNYLSARTYYRQVGVAFLNPTARGAIRGTTRWGLDGTFKAGKNRADFEFYSHSYEESPDAVKSLDVQYKRPLGKVDIAAGGIYLAEKDATRDQQFVVGTAGLVWHAFPWLDLRARRDQKLGSLESPLRPSLSLLGAGVNVTPRTSFYVDQYLYDAGPDKQLTVVGVSSTVAEGTSVEGKYQMAAMGQGRNMATIGLRNRAQVVSYLYTNVNVERNKVLSGPPADDFTAFSLGLEFLPPQFGKFAGKGEYRTANDRETYLAYGAMDVALTRDLGLLLKHTFYRESPRVAAVIPYKSNRFILGLTIRPVEWDQLNLLAKLQIVDEDTLHPVLGHRRNQAIVTSTEGIVEPFKRGEVMLRYALKRQSLTISPLPATVSWTDLYVGRFGYDLLSWVDGFVEGRLLHQRETGTFKQGVGVEIGGRMLRNVRFGVGFNFSGFRDDILSDQDYWGFGPYVNLKVKFDERGWKGIF